MRCSSWGMMALRSCINVCICVCVCVCDGIYVCYTVGLVFMFSVVVNESQLLEGVTNVLFSKHGGGSYLLFVFRYKKKVEIC